MKIHCTFPIHKVISGDMEIPDNLLVGKSEEEKKKVYLACIAKQFSTNKGCFIYEDEIEFNDTEVIDGETSN